MRPLTFRELLDEPFAVIQANIVALAVLGAGGLLVAELFVLGVTAALSHLTDGSDAGTGWGAVLGAAVAILVLRFVIRGGTVALGLATVAGRRENAWYALGALRDRFGALLRYQLWFSTIGVLVGGIVTPLTGGLGIIWLAFLRAKRHLVVPLLLGERLPYAAATARSELLVERATGSTAWLWCCRLMLLAVLALPLLAIPLFLSDFTGTRRWAAIALLTGGVLLLAAVGELVDAASRVTGYIDRRCRREGLDIVVPGAPR